MKKHLLLSTVVLLGSFAVFAFAAGRGNVFVQKVSRNDGDTMTPLYVSCSSQTWKSLLPVSPTRRVAKLITLASTEPVCLSTVSAVGITCSAALPSYRLNATIPFEHASEAIVYCRVADTKADVAVYGLDYKDSADNTSFP